MLAARGLVGASGSYVVCQSPGLRKDTDLQMAKKETALAKATLTSVLSKDERSHIAEEMTAVAFEAGEVGRPHVSVLVCED